MPSTDRLILSIVFRLRVEGNQKTLKETHKTLKSEVNTLLRQLRKNGVLNESETNK